MNLTLSLLVKRQGVFPPGCGGFIGGEPGLPNGGGGFIGNDPGPSNDGGKN